VSGLRNCDLFPEFSDHNSYGDRNGASIDAAKNNGNIVQQVITVPQVGESDNSFVATQKYYYDSLNRIDDATETISSQTWRQDFSYDRYGNRNFVEANTTFFGFDKLCNGNTELCSTLRKQLNPGINSSNNNRINSGQDYTYDAAGNTLTDANSQSYGERTMIAFGHNCNQPCLRQSCF